MRIIAIDVKGNYGQFKRNYTTSSPLTYSLITPTAIYGMIGAILGLDKKNNEYLNFVNQETVRVGARSLAPIQKTVMSLNYLNAKEKDEFFYKKGQSPTRVEWLKNVKTRIFISFSDNDLADQFKDMVENSRNVYPVYLGTTECVATVEYVGDFEAEKIENEVVLTGCAVPIDLIYKQPDNFSIEINGFKYDRERFPVQMKPSREATYANVLIEKEARKFRVSVKEAWNCGEEVVVFYNEIA